MDNKTFRILSFESNNFLAGDFLRICIQEAERIRTLIREKGIGHYYVTNVLFGEWKSPEELVNWVYWILKVAYTSESLMFGKFIKNKLETTQRKKSQIISPCRFISIRETVGRPDWQLLDEEFSKILSNSKPSLQDVLYQKYGRTTDDLLSCDSEEAFNYMIEKSSQYIND
ncbi:hypothetical Protein YC6258_05179 [Gynuella sunshinyii YC6258]|uniref:Uncharacterized protein n=2 Tax=Gynuella sunshinyii TaxID=1445505 RepID=A0A0C5W3K8_9GAMM|nr:hypothetical protein [Gynuella sunshinyii]AJQ97209.1 hypothetical Protein YC6258_05179 [Gynuella sunshinyii YC6258]